MCKRVPVCMCASSVCMYVRFKRIHLYFPQLKDGKLWDGVTSSASGMAGKVSRVLSVLLRVNKSIVDA